MAKTLIIIRGIPGSGKSTLARVLMNSVQPTVVVHCEADQFFTDAQGVFHYQARLVMTAHQWCLRKCRKALEEGVPLVIVSNCGVRTKEVQEYLDAAEAHGYQVQQIIMFAKFGSVHSTVTEEVCKNYGEHLRFALTNELKEGKLP